MLVSLVFCGLLAWALFASANSGIALALLAEHLGRVELIVGFAVIFLYWGGIAASVGLGRSPHKAFSDRNLRHYPLTRFERKIVRHVAGILDPVWVCCLAVGWGLVIGLAVSGRLVLTSSLIAVFILVIAGYLSSLLLLTIVERLLANVAGAAFFSFLAVLVMAALSWLLRTHRISAAVRSPYLTGTPPGAAALVMLHPWSIGGLWGMFLLVSWCAALWIAVGAAEALQWKWMPSRSDIAVSRSKAWSFAAGGKTISVLMRKSLTYHLRCNRVRLGLVLTIPVLSVYNQWMGSKEGVSGTAFGSLAAFFLLGLFATRAMILNQFGYEGAGFRRYLCAPVSLRIVLFANTIVSVLLGWALTIPALLIFRLQGVIRYDLRWVVLLAFSAMAGALFFAACGIWTSVFAPRSVVFGKIMGNDMSLAGNLIVFVGFLLCFGAAYLSSEQFQFSSVLEYWFCAPVVAVGAAGLYAATVISCSRLLQQRRASIAEIAAVSGTV